LEVRKPLYNGSELHAGIHQDLVDAYIGIDPGGYADAVREALAYLQHELTLTGEDLYMVQGSMRDLALSLGRYDDAHAAAMRSLELANADKDRHTAEHFSVFVYSGLCEVAYGRRDWDALRDWSSAGEEVVRRVGHQLELSEFLVWQALLAQHG